MSKENYIHKTFEHDRDKFEKSLSLNARAYLIADAVALGMTYRQIVSKYMKEWGVSYNYMHSIITESMNLFKSEELYKSIRDINNERLTDIYKRASEREELNVAIKAIDTLNKANGVYDLPKTLVNVLTDDSNVVITFGGESVESVEAKFNLKPEEVSFTEVDSLISDVLNKKLKTE